MIFTEVNKSAVSEEDVFDVETVIEKNCFFESWDQRSSDKRTLFSGNFTASSRILTLSAGIQMQESKNAKLQLISSLLVENVFFQWDSYKKVKPAVEKKFVFEHREDPIY